MMKKRCFFFIFSLHQSATGALTATMKQQFMHVAKWSAARLAIKWIKVLWPLWCERKKNYGQAHIDIRSSWSCFSFSLLLYTSKNGYGLVRQEWAALCHRAAVSFTIIGWGAWKRKHNYKKQKKTQQECGLSALVYL